MNYPNKLKMLFAMHEKLGLLVDKNDDLLQEIKPKKAVKNSRSY